LTVLCVCLSEATVKLKNYTEAELITGCIRNDRMCQEALYRRYFPTMMRLCARYTDGDKERALEIVNDGFLRIFKKINTFEGKGSLEGWIRRLMIHAVSDYFKAHKKYIENTFFEEENILATLPKTTTTEGVTANLYFEDLMRLVDTLPPATKEVFGLFALEGYKHEEIAEQLKISVGTSKWHVATAKEKLKALISKTVSQEL
jgi:RNA polymerase sigma factor (sigma-70 family)